MPQSQIEKALTLARKNGLASAPDELEKIIGSLSKFMEPAINAASTGAPLGKTWRPGGPWRRTEDS